MSTCSTATTSEEERWSLLAGEYFSMKDEVSELRGQNWVKGTLYVTNYRIVFEPEDTKQKYTSVPLTAIHACSKIGGAKTARGENAYQIELHTKDTRKLNYSFNPQHKTRKKIFKAISKELDPKEFFCFQHEFKADINGWDLYSENREFTRQGVFEQFEKESSQWRISSANSNFQFAETYPHVLVVPKSLTDEDLQHCGKCRSRQRIPVLTYFYSKNKTTITRSSQPLIGMGVVPKKMKWDHKLVNAIIETTEGKKMMIVDLRPRANAEANKMFKGAGYEKDYKDCNMQFLGIDNIHVMRASYRKLLALVQTTEGMDVAWHSKLEATDWLFHLHKILQAAAFCARCMHVDNMHLLIHCSDGWDRTAQVCALTQIILDPYFRTMEGFAVLIEKDFCSFGHQFHKRTNPGERNFYDDDSCPVFFQFLEAVYQLLIQHPTAFEFSQQFLQAIAHHLYSCRFGTFLYNCAKQRHQNQVYTKTPSLWTYLLSKKDVYRNPFYDAKSTAKPISTDLRFCSFRLWTEYWLKYASKRSHPQVVLTERGLQMYKEMEDLKKQVQDLQNKLKELEEKQKQAEKQTDESEKRQSLIDESTQTDKPVVPVRRDRRISGAAMQLNQLELATRPRKPSPNSPKNPVLVSRPAELRMEALNLKPEVPMRRVISPTSSEEKKVDKLSSSVNQSDGDTQVNGSSEKRPFRGLTQFRNDLEQKLAQMK